MKPNKKTLTPQETGDCLFRILFLLQMVDSEIAYLANRPYSSEVRTALSRGKNNYEYTVNTLRRALPMANLVVEQHIKKSDGKIAAIANIIEKIFLLDEASVLLLEKEYEKEIPIKWADGTATLDAVTPKDKPSTENL